MLRSIFLTLALTGIAIAEDGDADGTLNPEELSLRGQLDRLRHNELGPMTGSYGYAAAKEGSYSDAREIFGTLAEQGNMQAMSWMAWVEDNGLGGLEDAEKAAEWDRRAMEAGSEVGMFNYGLDLLRGRGVEQDEAHGRALVARAASLGSRAAQHLVDSDFDLDVVTPDADNWKYEEKLF